MKTFQEIKEQIITMAKKAGACEGQFKRVLNSENEQDLMRVIKGNISWCYNNLDLILMLDLFDINLCVEFGIYHKGEIESITNKKGLIFLGDFKCKMLDNSQVSEMMGNSQVSVMRGNSQVGEMWGNSQVGEMWGNSQVGEMWVNSQVGEMWDNSQVGEMRGNSISRSYNCNLPKYGGDRYCYVDLKNNKVYIGENLSL